MGLENSVEKLDKYYARLEQGKAQKIKPSHVDKILSKLEAKARLLQAELDETTKSSKKERLATKLDMVREQQKRARWLKDKIGDA
ncbi:hypothetical protein SAMN05444851_1567 [Aliiroseovarius sediminilitoris]|uniref:Uncharacterized protein n=1 Tax=Aliiroseovarius sediminilitoris TaxID=1173584 RepID=A0A1I0PFU1_9RHOB|nr:hypothetical protein [Aliiroseovarius sediminilitoris]SEW12516.1 hypothetical protein SAMN05444851_1567 [Aliiroseovarius sediminilitoris]